MISNQHCSKYKFTSKHREAVDCQNLFVSIFTFIRAVFFVEIKIENKSRLHCIEKNADDCIQNEIWTKFSISLVILSAQQGRPHSECLKLIHRTKTTYKLTCYCHVSWETLYMRETKGECNTFWKGSEQFSITFSC